MNMSVEFYWVYLKVNMKQSRYVHMCVGLSTRGSNIWVQSLLKNVELKRKPKLDNEKNNQNLFITGVSTKRSGEKCKYPNTTGIFKISAWGVEEVSSIGHTRHCLRFAIYDLIHMVDILRFSTSICHFGWFFKSIIGSAFSALIGLNVFDGQYKFSFTYIRAQYVWKFINSF